MYAGKQAYEDGNFLQTSPYEPAHMKRALIKQANSEGSSESVHPRSHQNTIYGTREASDKETSLLSGYVCALKG